MRAQAAVKQGSIDECIKAASEALGIFQALKEKAGESAALLLVATASHFAGQFEDALSCAEDAAALAKRAGSVKQVAYSKAKVAEAALDLLQTKNNPDEQLQKKALEAAQEASKGLKEMAQRAEYAKVLSGLSHAYLLCGNSNMAIAKAKAAQRLYQSDHDVAGEAAVLLTLSKALQKEGSTEPAKQTLEDASNMFASLGDQSGQIAACKLLQGFQSQESQEKRDFTQRILARFNSNKENKDENDVANHRVTPGNSARFFSPPMQQQTFGPPTTRFIGFMARAAAPPAPKAGGGGVQNRRLLYNVSWN